MTTYLITTEAIDGFTIARRPAMGSLVLVNPSVTGGGTTTTDTTGSGGVPPAAAVGYLWPRGDGTPAGA